MLAFRPVLGDLRPRLGQFGGLTDSLAKSIVAQAEPATRRVIRDERNRLAEALIGGLPFAAVSAIAFVGTRYLVPDESKKAKFAGYAGAAAALGGGAWWSFSKLTESTGPAAESSAAPSPVADVASQAAKAIVDQAEPKIRAIVEEERGRISEAAMAGLPLWLASAITFAATAFLVSDGKPVTKTIGYSASAAIATIGAYIALSKETSA